MDSVAQPARRVRAAGEGVLTGTRTRSVDPTPQFDAQDAVLLHQLLDPLLHDPVAVRAAQASLVSADRRAAAVLALYAQIVLREALDQVLDVS